jgi:hypothetical protein
LADTNEQLAAVEAFATAIVESVRETDPDVTFVVRRPLDPGIWLLYLYVRPEVAADVDFREVVVGRTNDILVKHGIAIATLWRTRDRQDNSPGGAG